MSRKSVRASPGSLADKPALSADADGAVNEVVRPESAAPSPAKKRDEQDQTIMAILAHGQSCSLPLARSMTRSRKLLTLSIVFSELYQLVPLLLCRRDYSHLANKALGFLQSRIQSYTVLMRGVEIRCLKTTLPPSLNPPPSRLSGAFILMSCGHLFLSLRESAKSETATDKITWYYRSREPSTTSIISPSAGTSTDISVPFLRGKSSAPIEGGAGREGSKDATVRLSPPVGLLAGIPTASTSTKPTIDWSNIAQVGKGGSSSNGTVRGALPFHSNPQSQIKSAVPSPAPGRPLENDTRGIRVKDTTDPLLFDDTRAQLQEIDELAPVKKGRGKAKEPKPKVKKEKGKAKAKVVVEQEDIDADMDEDDEFDEGDDGAGGETTRKKKDNHVRSSSVSLEQYPPHSGIQTD